ncbi:MAG: hypothetical protein ACRD1R_04240 [Acidobacteriota bacterium]
MAPSEYRGPVLGLIFLAYAEHRFDAASPEIVAKATVRRPITADDYRAKSVLFVPDIARLCPISLAYPNSSSSRRARTLVQLSMLL